jgi:hypothetical protein
MGITSKDNKIGAWAFLVGVILAVVIGLSTAQFVPLESFAKSSSAIYGILVLLGLIVGFFIKIEDKESHTFLIAGAILVIVSKFGMESIKGSLIGVGIGDIVVSIFGALLILFVPATIIVALKTVFGLTKV